METNREWPTQPLYANYESNQFLSESVGADRHGQPQVWDTASIGHRECFQQYSPNYGIMSNLPKSITNGKRVKEQSGLPTKSFSNDDHHAWLAETISTEIFLSTVSNGSATADSSGLSDVRALLSSQHEQKSNERRSRKLPSVDDDQTSEYDSDNCDLSDGDQKNVNGHIPLGDSSSCNICGDVVAGFHCGAYVCEACKKFFVRCLKQDTGSKFTCSQNNHCVITKETRTQCPHCRYQKCLALGMYRPGGPNLSSEIRHIPCTVCGAPSSGFHFGAITCEGCKGFFRRSVKERDCLKYQCTRNGKCNITSKTRNVCKMCRYQQCLNAGMKPDKSRIGRQPNAIKHATFVQLNRIKLEKGIPASNETTFNDCKTTMDIAEFGQSHSFVEDGDNFNITSSLIGQNVNGAKPARKKQNQNRPLLPRAGQNHEDLLVSERSGSFFQVDQIKQESLSPLQSDPGDGSSTQPDAEGILYLGSVTSEDCIDWNKDSVEVINVSQENLPKPGFDPSHRDISKFCHEVINLSESMPYPMAVANQTQNRGSSQDIQAVCGDSGATVQSIARVEQPVLRRQSSNEPVTLESIIISMQQAYHELEPLFLRAPSNLCVHRGSTQRELWDSQMGQFAHSARAILKFSKKVPGFRSFSIEEQISMVQTCMFPIVAVVLSLTYDVIKRDLRWFNFTSDEMKLIFECFDPFCHLEETMHVLGQAIHDLCPDEIEVAFLCGIHLIDSGSQPLFKEQLVDALGEYTTYKLGQNGQLRKGHILMCLRDMAETNQRHQETVALLLSDARFAHLEVPQLFKETFVGMDD